MATARSSLTQPALHDTDFIFRKAENRTEASASIWCCGNVVIERDTYPLLYPTSISRAKKAEFMLIGLLGDEGCVIGDIVYENFQFLESFYGKTLWLPVTNPLTAMGAVIVSIEPLLLVAFITEENLPVAPSYDYLIEEKAMHPYLLDTFFILAEVDPHSHLFFHYSSRRQNHTRKSLDLEVDTRQTECRNGSCTLHFIIETLDSWQCEGFKTGTPTEILAGTTAIKLSWGNPILNQIDVQHISPKDIHKDSTSS